MRAAPSSPSIGVGLCPTPGSPYMQKPTSLLDATFDLYKFLPHDSDPRWAFLTRYDEIRRAVGFSAINFANAWRATYLSTTPSYKRGFVNSLSEENCLQLERALDNLSQRQSVAECYVASHGGYQAFDMRLALTDRLTNDPTKAKRDVTPCPEALYQVRLFDGQYLGRVGFNLHHEDDSTVLSIVNIQGVPGGTTRNANFKAASGISPFNLLVKRVLALAEVQDPTYEVRGMINPERGSPQLYWGVLKEEDVEKWHAQRKPVTASL